MVRKEVAGAVRRTHPKYSRGLSASFVLQEGSDQQSPDSPNRVQEGVDGLELGYRRFSFASGAVRRFAPYAVEDAILALCGAESGQEKQ